MRLSASTVAFPGMALAVLPAHARALGVDGLAVTVSPRGAMAPDASPADLSRFRLGCREQNVQVSALYGYAGRGLLGSSAEAQDDIDLAKRCLDLTVELGAPVCRLFAGTARPTDDLIDRFIERCRPVASHAAGLGVKLGFPTHHDLAFDPASCRRLIDGLGRDRAGIIFNGPSMELDGIDPVAALGEMIGLVEQVELKDWRRNGVSDIPVPLGQGDATITPIVEYLAEEGFTGWVTLHHLKQHHPELPDLTFAAGEAIRAVYAASKRPACGADRTSGPGTNRTA